MSIRVAALIATETVSGPGRQLAALARGIAQRDVRIEVLLTNRTAGSPPFAEYLQSAGVKHALVADRGPLDWTMVRTLRQVLEDRGLNLLQTHGYKATAIGFALRQLDPALRWIGFYHGATSKGLKDAAYQKIERRLIRSADRIVVVSRHQASLFPGRAGVLRVIDNAVVADFAARDAETGAGIVRPEERPAIGVIGRLSHEKGVDVFLHSCRLLADRGTAFTAYIVGDGPARGELEALSRTLGLQQRVRFTGHVSAPATLYPTLDLVVLPSRSEGLPNVLLEALAADRPVVATAVGAVPEVIDEPEAGHLVQPEDPHALASAMAAALRSGITADGTRARQRVIQRYSLDARVERHIELYRELLQTPAPQLTAAKPYAARSTQR